MGSEERDWVFVANDLLCKCHIKLRIQKITDCDASVFVALYENILGEKCPDYASPKCQEDDIHNVQSVIDSLALDYLQISLSHITGENIVRGDKDSIRNLLEIFDGLLEYLSEEEEEHHNGELNGTVKQSDTHKLDKEESMSQTSSTHSAVQSSKPSPRSWSGEESNSTAELIRLGDSARTFTVNTREGTPPLPSGPSSPQDAAPEPAPAQATLLCEPMRSAVPLQPPSQTTPQRAETRLTSPSERHSFPSEQGRPDTGAAVRQNGLSPGLLSSDLQSNGTLNTPHSSELSDGSAPVRRELPPDARKGPVEGGGEGPRRVLFRTQPDVRLLSVSGEQERSQGRVGSALGPGEEDGSEDERPQSSGSSSGRRRSYGVRRWEDGEDSLSRCSQRNRRAEQELQEMSEKLSRRLEVLDLMLKRALDQTGEEPKSLEEDKRSHHSDSIMECRRGSRPTDAADEERPSRTRSLSPSPPPPLRSHQTQTQLQSAADSQHDTHLQEQRRKGQMVADAYKAELKHLDERQKAELAFERLRAQKAERAYREAIRKEAARVTKSAQSHRSKPTLSSKKSKQALPTRRQAPPLKPAPMKVKENNLLPTLLEDFPPLHFSPHTLSSMWRQQLRQVDQLNATDNQRKSAHSSKPCNQVEDAQRRHDLLMELIRKDQEHNQRLKDVRERVQQQRSAQNKLRDQRQQVARARKYHNDYHVQLRARLLRARTREERMFKQVFEEGLELQKARLREQRANAKEQRERNQRVHQDEIEAMENYYRDQFSMLAERLALERQEIQVRKHAQEKALQKMKRELRSRMEQEISELQQIIMQNDQEDYYRELETERLRRRVRAASFQYSTGCTH